MTHAEYDLTAEEAATYCAGSEHQRVREVVATRARGLRVIDVGCGRGIDARRYRPEDYLGVDGSHALVSAARRQNPGYEFAVADARQIAKPDKSFDVAVLKSVLEHAHSQEEALEIFTEALRVARVVLVAWHTPPRRNLGAPKTRVVPGHFGRLVHQNVYQLEAFEAVAAARGPERISSSRVDNFTLWEISGMSSEWTDHGVVMPAGFVEDFRVVGPNSDGEYWAYFVAGVADAPGGRSFTDLRLHRARAGGPLGPVGAWERVAPGIAHTRLYSGRVDTWRRIVTAPWPGLPKAGLWLFTEEDFGMVKELLIAPNDGTGYSEVAGNPTVALVGIVPLRYEIFFEGRAEAVRWSIFRAEWDGKSPPRVDAEPFLRDAANPSLVRHGDRLYLYYSKHAPGGLFETRAMSRAL